QKYRPAEEIRSQYPKIVKAYLQGKFPQPIVERLRDLLTRLRGSPLAVRSSSLLEDNFELSLAGKYSSYFCANQGSDEENLKELMDAIKKVYASTLSPEALLYRRENNLLDYDERMAVLVQRVQGERYGRYFLPIVSGIAFSQTPVRWHPKIKHADGFLRMVWGLGTRAANRIGGDYPRLVALSHPQLRPETSTAAIRAYSQKLVDVVDMEENKVKTLPVADVLGPDFPYLAIVASLDRGDRLEPIFNQTAVHADDTFVLTFDALTRDARFVKLMRTALMQLQRAYQRPVDVEFALTINTDRATPNFQLTILQCRPLSQRMEGELLVTLPRNIPSADLLFSSHWLVPDGRIKNIRTIVLLDPQAYQQP
ncbi:PEP/pyruvate-binding domain-containing protein, partial [Arthrospira platensis SPKY1]|nr:PEP/pyruvate-binding domain-containing protein [Arthrospira platensis SPKY1]